MKANIFCFEISSYRPLNWYCEILQKTKHFTTILRCLNATKSYHISFALMLIFWFRLRLWSWKMKWNFGSWIFVSGLDFIVAVIDYVLMVENDWILCWKDQTPCNFESWVADQPPNSCCMSFLRQKGFMVDELRMINILTFFFPVFYIVH